jgi:hypothetical protein
MKKLVLLLLCCLTLAGYAQQRRVKVATNKGAVYVGTLEKFKAFEYVIIIMDGRSIMIPYNEMAYIDDITATEAVETPVIAEDPILVDNPKDYEEPVAVEEPTKAPTVATVKAPAKASAKAPAKASAKAPAKTPAKTTPTKTPAKATTKSPAKKWVACSVCGHNPGVCQTCLGIGKTVDGQTCMSCKGSKKCRFCDGKGGSYQTAHK